MPLRVSGQVVDRHTAQPVAGATVQLYAQAGSGLAVGGYGSTGKTHAADAQGRFSFDAVLPKRAHFLLLAQAPPAYHTLWSEAPVLSRRHPREGLRVPVQAPAYLRLHLLDDPPSSRAIIRVYGYGSNVDEFNYPVTSTHIRMLDAGEKRRINWEIQAENGQKLTGGQDLLVPSLDTQTVTIHF
ncbi:hypothetical protein [Hymenobacter cellulosivorans]|uniref:Carboxypeptidase regulatory-like domain-containing protein n=1 Tax=Hymenobacter cellulosivorans TaxID=2932249 RepID=A0ABY4FB93_9BACT|nr:hypothetical protein [Hymenobacter cellulosivorans]UOQ53948.1 hypothetical protein MUN80_04095 [Hymenobacter cellulosivorans]